MNSKNDSSKSNFPKKQDGNRITLADAPTALLEIEAKLLELDEAGTVKERQLIIGLLEALGEAADLIAAQPLIAEAA